MKNLIISKKYSTICNDTINRITEDIKFKFPKLSDKELIKKVKEELYEIHLNYFKSVDYKKALIDFNKSLSKDIHIKWLKKYDNNRFESLDNFYDEVFKITGKPKILLDLACGLNPLTLPWMNLEKNTKYYCYDIEKHLINFLNDYFKIIKKNYIAYLQDMISNPPEIKADVGLLMKATTCFEWQKQGNTVEMLKKLNCNWVVISLMMRGKYNLNGCRNYFKKLLEKDFANNKKYEIVLKKEYVLILKLNK